MCNLSYTIKTYNIKTSFNINNIHYSFIKFIISMVIFSIKVKKMCYLYIYISIHVLHIYCIMLFTI